MQDSPDVDAFLEEYFRLAIEATDAGVDIAILDDHCTNNIFRMAEPLEQPGRREFVLYALDRKNELFNLWLSNERRFRRDIGAPPAKRIGRRSLAPRRQGDASRTFTRAVIWNAVSTVFRGFR